MCVCILYLCVLFDHLNSIIMTSLSFTYITTLRFILSHSILFSFLFPLFPPSLFFYLHIFYPSRHSLFYIASPGSIYVCLCVYSCACVSACVCVFVCIYVCVCLRSIHYRRARDSMKAKTTTSPATKRWQRNLHQSGRRNIMEAAAVRNALHDLTLPCFTLPYLTLPYLTLPSLAYHTRALTFTFTFTFTMISHTLDALPYSHSYFLSTRHLCLLHLSSHFVPS